MKKLLIILTLSVLSTLAIASDDIAVVPKSLINLDSYFSHHVLIAEKSTHQLHLYRNENGYPRHIRSYQMATGKKAGNKSYQGDHRTPEGVYHFNQFLTHKDLIDRHGKQGEIYGVGAFVMDYPNPIDKQNGKTGGGIWLHSTNDETRIEKGLDSRGCIVSANKHLIDIAKYIELHRTPIIVVHELEYLRENSWRTKREELLTSINDWAKAWREEDFKKYISFYHKGFFDKNRGNLNQFTQYKKAVFSNPGKPFVEITNLSIQSVNGYTVATFKQKYESKNIKDLGKKTLYLKRDEFYKWKVVSELWTKHGITEEAEEQDVAFQPSMRFFTTLNPSKIFEAANKGQN